VAAPTTPLPPDTPITEEREVLEGFLDYLRVVLVRKAEGITDDEARRAACPPSDLTILGLIRHMTEVERIWFRATLGEGAAPPIYYGDAHPDGDRDGDFHAPADATLADAVARWSQEVETSRRVLAGVTDLAQEGHDREHRNVRWILVHMVEEYARHCGHADLLRQAIDGVVDD
jgi:uncharacterized damage-inducible protein DinB